MGKEDRIAPMLTSTLREEIVTGTPGSDLDGDLFFLRAALDISASNFEREVTGLGLISDKGSVMAGKQTA
tara:strand:- start:54 stop:263 length:210 start_codon:yes stop_codon:yes gene_type:complete